ncbi:MAG: substrate-binding domain-containing protein [Pseudomonadota bacterium]
MRTIVTIAVFIILFQSASQTAANEIRMAVTTSFNNSGLSDVLLPEIKKDLNLEVRLLIVGTGQALKLGRSGDVDAILVHSKAAEEKFIEDGYGTHRREIMYNDFVVVGPKADPADVKSSISVADAFQRIRNQRAVFVSRGDDSGTQKKEVSLWKSINANPDLFQPTWYRDVGSGMGASLNTAVGLNAYILSDRASWHNFSNQSDFEILFAGDPALFNQYAFLPVNPIKHPHVQHNLALKLEEWLVSEKAQQLVGSYEIDGETLFTPNAKVQD